MALDRSMQVLRLLAPIAGTIPVGGGNLQAALDAATQICEIAQVCYG
jgi:hypothetical protein